MFREGQSLDRWRRFFRCAAILAAAALFQCGAGFFGVTPISAAGAGEERTQGPPLPPVFGPPSLADLVDRVRGAVVGIKVKATETIAPESFNLPELSPDDPLYYFFKRFGEGLGGSGQKRLIMSQGSGFLISADGYVVTNKHVVEGASKVEVTLDDGRILPVEIVGADKQTDLALLKIKEGGGFPYVEWSRARPRVGDWVMVVGNPFGLGGTVTVGVVSAHGRDIGVGPYDDFLQIDAPINRGDSGGPTFDMRGSVIGVNAAIYSPSGGSIGIGFAVPAEVARDVVAALKEKGVVARGWIGVQLQALTQDIAENLGLKSTKGALVAQAQKGSPAEAAGLKPGDVITAVDGEKIDVPRELARRIAALAPGKRVEFAYLRGGLEMTAKVTLGALPEEEAKAAPRRFGQGPGFASLGFDVAPAADLRGSGGEGLYITDIEPDGLAAQKGLRRGEVILEAAGKPVNAKSELSAAFENARKEGRKSVLLRIRSEEGVRFVALPVVPS